MKNAIYLACVISLLTVPLHRAQAQSCIAANDTSTDMIRRISGIMSGKMQDEKGRMRRDTISCKMSFRAT